MSFYSYQTTNANIATVSGTTVTAKAAGSVQIRSNWYVNHPGTTGHSSWTYGSRTSTTNASAAANARYYYYYTNGSCNYAGTMQSTSGYSGGTTTRSWTRSSTAAYMCTKVCTTSNNYNGTTRCSPASHTGVYVDTASSHTASWGQNASNYVVSNWSGGCSSFGRHRHRFTGAYAWRNSWQSGKANWNNYFIYCNETASGGYHSVSGTRFDWAWFNANCQGVDIRPSISSWYEWWGINDTYCVHTGKTTRWQQP